MLGLDRPLVAYKTAGGYMGAEVVPHMNWLGLFTIIGVYGSFEIRLGGSKAWRNNNPGNLVHGDFARRHGAIGEDFDDSPWCGGVGISQPYVDIIVRAAMRSGVAYGFKTETGAPFASVRFGANSSATGCSTVDTLNERWLCS